MCSTAVQAAPEKYNLSEHLFYIEDSIGMDYTAVEKAVAAGHCQKADVNKAFNKGFSKNIFWFYFQMDSAQIKDELLYYSIRNSSLDSLRIFIQYQDTFVQYLMGDRFPFHKRPFVNRNFITPIYLRQLGNCKVITQINRKNASTYVSYGMSTPENMYRSELKHYTTFAGFTIFYLVCAIATLFLAIILKDRVYLYFSIYTLCLMFIITDEDGFAFEWFYPNYPSVNNWIYIVSYFISSYMLVAMMRRFIYLRQKNFTLFKISNFVLITCAVLGIIELFISKYFNNTKRFLVSDINYYIVLAFVFTTLIIEVFRKNRNALYYLFSITFMILGSLALHLNAIGITNSNPFKYNGIVWGMTIQIALLFFAFLYRYYLHIKEKDSLQIEVVKKEKEIISEKERIRSDMHDELGSGLSSIKLSAVLVGNRTTDDTIKGEVEEIIANANSLNESMRELVWSLNTNNDSLHLMIAYIAEYCDNYLSKAKIALSIIRNEIVDQAVNANVRSNVLLIIKEACNNIVKHSQAKNVHLSFEIDTIFLYIVISDDGIGLNHKSSNGNGLQIMQNRAKNCLGELEVVSNKGTTITLKIKLKPESSKN